MLVIILRNTFRVIEYKVHKQEYSNKLSAIVQKIDEKMSSSISYYEKLVSGDISETEFTELMSVGRVLTLERDKLLASKKEYGEKYKVFLIPIDKRQISMYNDAKATRHFAVIMDLKGYHYEHKNFSRK